MNLLNLWQLANTKLNEEQTKQLITPNKCGKIQRSLDNFSILGDANTFIMLMGVPGSGKTTFANQLEVYYTGIGVTSKIISVDNIIFNHINNMLLNGSDFFNTNLDFQSIQLECLQNELNQSVNKFNIVILDGVFLDELYRMTILKYISTYFSNIIGIFLDTDIEILKTVQSERLFSKLSDEDFNYYYTLSQNYLNKDLKKLPIGFDTVYIVQR